MHYVKSLFYNFLTVFFANHLLPGIELLYQTRLPHFGTDLPFALGVGFLNSLIYPICKLLSLHISGIRIALIAFVLNFAIYGALKIAPIGINMLSMEGFAMAATVVTIGSFLTNYIYMRSRRHHHLSRKSSEYEVPSPSINKFDEWKNPPL